MKRVRGNLCRTAKGKFTRCRGKTTGGSKGRRKKGRRCKYGVAKRGTLKGSCLKHPRRKK
jgi:hypothetical protein